MPTRNMRPDAHQQPLVETLVSSGRADEIKLQALQQAASQGWAAIAAGRYTDVACDQLANFVGRLGRRAAHQAKTAGSHSG